MMSRFWDMFLGFICKLIIGFVLAIAIVLSIVMVLAVAYVVSYILAKFFGLSDSTRMLIFFGVIVLQVLASILGGRRNG